MGVLKPWFTTYAHTPQKKILNYHSYREAEFFHSRLGFSQTLNICSGFRHPEEGLLFWLQVAQLGRDLGISSFCVSVVDSFCHRAHAQQGFWRQTLGVPLKEVNNGLARLGSVSTFTVLTDAATA